MKKILLIILSALPLLASCEELMQSFTKQGILQIRFAQGTVPSTRAAFPDTNDFIITITDGKGNSVYDGIFGALAARKVKKTSLGKLFVFCISLALTGLVSEFTGIWYLMTLGGFVTAFADDLIQIRSDIALNQMVPAEQRATLISVNSFCFSVLMIVMSPLAGYIFSI